MRKPYFERYAQMTISNDLLRLAVDAAKEAQKAGDTERSQIWLTTVAGMVVLMEDEHIPIKMVPNA